MKILFCGDVVARSGRETILHYVPILKKSWKLDCVIINGENAQHGFGLSAKACSQFYNAGVDVITMGNHTWDQKEMMSYIETDPHVIRPINYPDSVPGKGFFVLEKPTGNILIVNVMGQTFMNPILENPFICLDNFLKSYVLGSNKLKAIIVDFHAEATAEKVGFGFYLDGRVSLVVGTHTHIPTSDARILPNGTGFISDSGMCGDYNSIIGAPLESLPYYFIKKMPMRQRPDPSTERGTLCGVYLETDDATGKAVKISSVCLGPVLENHIPTGLPAVE